MTKLAPLVLACIVTLALVAGVGLALSYGAGLPHRVYGDPIDDPKPNRCRSVLVPGYRVFGDPINDPKPNHK